MSRETFGQEFESLLPDGWAEGDDFFNMDSWSGTADAQETGESVEPEKNLSLEELFNAESADDAEDVPTTDEEPAAESAPKLKFKAKVDHEDRDVELDESELPNLYQKAQVVDRVQEKLNKQTPILQRAEKMARQLGYDSVDEMLTAADTSYRETELAKLTDGGVHPDVADAVLEWKMSKLNDATPHPETEQEAVPQPQQSNERDYRSEVVELLKAAPELKGKSIPNDVVTEAVAQNIPLTQAYNSWKERQNKAEAEALRKENRVLKQNADAAARAPVRRTTRGGATDTKPDKKDPFLVGFDSDY